MMGESLLRRAEISMPPDAVALASLAPSIGRFVPSLQMAACALAKIGHTGPASDCSVQVVKHRQTTRQMALLARATCRHVSIVPFSLVAFSRQYTVKRGDEAELQAARQWLSKLDPETIPKGICEVSFSRSSGPGGQNVNK